MSQQYSLNPRVRHRRVGDEGVVICMHSGDVLVVNSVGAHIVQQLSEPQSKSDLLASICSVFDVPEDQARQDLNHYIQALSEQGVLSPISATDDDS